MNNTTQKIAAEAWKEILDYDDGIVGKQSPQIDTACTAIIQSTIEKATEQLRKENQRLSSLIPNADVPRAAHASEDNLSGGADPRNSGDVTVAGVSRSNKAAEASPAQFPSRDDANLVLGALDSLGVALADHDHQWTEGERAIYEKAVEIVQSRAAHASEPQFNLETLEGRKAAWAWLQQKFCNPLVVTKDGVPFEDQAEGIRQFKAAAHTSEGYDTATKESGCLRAWPVKRKPAHASEQGAGLIASERSRQVTGEGWTPEHDATHKTGEMLRAALAYGWQANKQIQHGSKSVNMPIDWPWGETWWKPSTSPIRNLVKCGALIAAEIDRLSQRPTPMKSQT